MFIYCFILFLFVAVPTVPTSPTAFLFSENGFILRIPMIPVSDSGDFDRASRAGYFLL